MKNIVIIGAAGGLGSELAKEFGAKGHRVAGIDLRDDAANMSIFSYHQCDVTNPSHATKTFDLIREELGEIDFVICSQGLALTQTFEGMSLDELRKVMEVNFFSVVHAAHYWRPHLEGRKTQFCVIGSVAGLVPSALLSAYCASKYALNGFIESLRIEWSVQDSSIGINHIAPGFIETKLIRLGEKMGFPSALRFLLGDPQKVAKEMARAILKNRPFYVPTFNGKLMQISSRLSPKALRLSSKILARHTLK